MAISIGVATVAPSSAELPATLVRMADQALYKAKNAGRNKIWQE
ncbi:MAG: diguanylate cyclase [Negativicutes bacterium]